MTSPTLLRDPSTRSVSTTGPVGVVVVVGVGVTVIVGVGVTVVVGVEVTVIVGVGVTVTVVVGVGVGVTVTVTVGVGLGDGSSPGPQSALSTGSVATPSPLVAQLSSQFWPGKETVSPCLTNVNGGMMSPAWLVWPGSIALTDVVMR